MGGKPGKGFLQDGGMQHQLRAEPSKPLKEASGLHIVSLNTHTMGPVPSIVPPPISRRSEPSTDVYEVHGGTPCPGCTVTTPVKTRLNKLAGTHFAREAKDG